MLNLGINILEQGLILGIMVLGVYITYKILDFPDLSVDGSFPLGAAVTASALTSGFSPYTACTLSFIAGSFAGCITGFLHVKLKITNLLSGILVMTGLYSINLRVMGKSNIPFFNKETIFSNNLKPTLLLFIFAFTAKLILDFFLNTKLGFILKATGDNPQLVTSLGVDIGKVKIFALGLSNGLVALSGSIMAQYQKFSDVGMGSGIIVMGLASIIFGESLLRKSSFVKSTTIVLIGSILYKSCTAFALRLGLPPTDLKLITTIIVVAAIFLNNNTIGISIKKLLCSGGGCRAADTKSV